MSQLLQSPVLVTGIHRSGTTWVGRMLAASSQLAYISEPLNVLHRPGLLQMRVVHWYTYVCRENETGFLASFANLLKYRYHLWAGMAALRSGGDFLRMGRDVGVCLKGWAFHRRPLVKDPFAVFSLPWFAERFHMQIVVTIRHPAGFASSLKRLGWPFDFRDLLDQPLLMRDHLEPYRRAMEAITPDDVVGQAAVLWAAVYRSVYKTVEQNPSIQVVRHEDLSLEPLEGFRKLYRTLNLEFTPRLGKAILDSSSSENPKEVSRQKAHAIQLDSRANLDNWKHRLSAEEILRIRRMTEEIAHPYYPEESWN